MLCKRRKGDNTHVTRICATTTAFSLRLPRYANAMIAMLYARF
jgi:hypothetical protein